MRAGAGLAVTLALAAGVARAEPVEDGAAHRLIGGDGSYAMPAWEPDGGGLVFHAFLLGEPGVD